MIKRLDRAQQQAVASYQASDIVRELARAQGFVDALVWLVAWFRVKPDDAATRMEALLSMLARTPEVRADFGAHFHQWLQAQHVFYSFAHIGMVSRQGLLHEARELLYDRINPPPRQAQYLHDVIQVVFDFRLDRRWLHTIAPKQWLSLYQALSEDETRRRQSAAMLGEEVRYSVEMLSIWLASEDLDPELIRLDLHLLDVDSPFVALHRAVQAFLLDATDDGEIDVMLDQSDEQIARLQRRALRSGSSLRTSHLLERLAQTLARLKHLLRYLRSEQGAEQGRVLLTLLAQMIEQGAQRRTLRQMVASSLSTISRSVAQHKSDYGEHYVTTDAAQYGKMWLSAAGAGVFIALMALIKLKLPYDLSPLSYALLSSLNYGLGFVLVHICGCTIATKQSAMTAAYMAQTIKSHGEGRRLARKLARLLVDVNRSQTIAVLGNVCVALAVAYVLASGYAHWQHIPVLNEAKAQVQLDSARPFPALLYAAIAALWLFCAGLIAGYYDNRAEYLHLRERLYQHPLLRRLMPEGMRRQFAHYMHVHFGAIHGNFLFGVMLGMTPYLGYLLNLPLDIRHVAFSSANLGYAAGSITMNGALFLQFLIFVLLIGAVNLWVSFALALRVALRAQNARFPSLAQFGKALWQEIRSNPLALLLPVGLNSARQQRDEKTPFNRDE